MTYKYDAILECYKFIHNYRGELVCAGIVYDDKLDRFVDGTPVVSTPIQSFFTDNEFKYIKTKNTTYKLDIPIQTHDNIDLIKKVDDL